MAVDLRRTLPWWAAATAVLAVAALSACASADGAEPAAAPTTSGAVAPTASAPAAPARGKLRGYGTVQQLTEAADLVVRGQLASAGFRVDEVLRARTDSGVRSGASITLASLDAGVADMAHMSTLKAGQHVVLYLSQDAGTATPTYRTLSGDFGIFDVTGSGDDAVAATRSQAMAVTGLRTEDATASGNGFRTTLGELRAVAQRP
ncbi:hypothetical protein ACIA3K_31200 [Micromonospora sp. NPDC051543]|uniref:hypothetical protein n=1 Tax=Micromonospora sp. NPDC051543 TaxID=3364287 RepID=UPI00378F133C